MKKDPKAKTEYRRFTAEGYINSTVIANAFFEKDAEKYTNIRKFCEVPVSYSRFSNSKSGGNKSGHRLIVSFCLAEAMPHLDCAVLDAATAFYRSGKTEFTVRDVVEYLYGEYDNPEYKITREKMAKIRGVLEKLSKNTLWAIITGEYVMRMTSPKYTKTEKLDMRAAVEQMKCFSADRSNTGKTDSSGEPIIGKDTEIRIKGELLPIRARNDKPNRKFSFEAPPLLYEYANALKGWQYSFPQEWLLNDGRMKNTENAALTRYYLIRRIVLMKRRGKSNEILINDIINFLDWRGKKQSDTKTNTDELNPGGD